MIRRDLVRAAGAPGPGALSPAAVAQHIAYRDRDVNGEPVQFSYVVLGIEIESV